MDARTFRLSRLVLLASALSSAACALPPADVNEGSTVQRDPAADQCDALVNKICDAYVPCGVAHADCVSQTNQAFQQNYGSTCSGADAVSSTYQTCLSDLNSPLNCSAPELPVNCQGVILFNK
ncbi:MAG: hypothetical protein U0263_37505 [Polyangiaceae bacterium]